MPADPPELERTRRELKANLGLITADSPALVPIQAHMQAIDAEIAVRAGRQQADGLLPSHSWRLQASFITCPDFAAPLSAAPAPR